MENAVKTSITFLSCVILTTFATHSNDIELTIGRYTQKSKCDVIYAVQANQTILLTSDGHKIDPPCEIDFVGFVMKQNCTTFDNLCYDLSDLKIPCGINNTISVKMMELEYTGNDTSIYVNYTNPLYEKTFKCRDIFNNFDEDRTCSMKPALFQIVMHIMESDRAFLPSITLKTHASQYRHNVSVSFKQNVVVVNQNNCLCKGPACPPCSKEFETDSFSFPSVVINEEETNDKNSKTNALDINNIITIIGGVVTSFIIPVLLLLIRNYVKNHQNKSPTNNRNPGDGSDAVDAKDDTSESDESETDIEESINNLLNTPRHSIHTDASSFHSAFTTV